MDMISKITSLIMNQFSDMLNENIVIATYVTTLIGTGGNAGNQAGALVISALSSGTIPTIELNSLSQV